VPDDRFSDLGSGTRAGDRLAELDATQPEPRPPQPPRRRGRYTWVVGVAAVILIAVVSLNTLDDPGEANRGLPVGSAIPRFAAPDARAGPDFDANINQSRSDPAPGNTPACEVHVPGAVRSCDFTSKPLVITFIVPTDACEDFVDRVERLRPRFPKVNFLLVVSAKPKVAKAVVEDRGWRQPAVADRSGAVLTRYRFGLCPNVVFAYRGGRVRATKAQAQTYTDAQLTAAIRATEKR